ncbi:MAG: hypothetical protein U0269_10885 [Polyangiales bacterium]
MLRRTDRFGLRLRASAVAALVSASASVAFAQQNTDEIHISPEGSAGETAPAPPADDTSAHPGELVIIVHELPPRARSVSDNEQPQRSTSTVAPQPVLPNEEPDTPARQERAFAPGLVFGANAGIGGPSGVLGAFVEAAPIRALSARLGAGIGLNFGPSIELGAIVRPTRWGRVAPIASLTYSTNFTPGSWRSILGLSAAANSHWLTPALGVEIRLRPIVLLRAYVGAAVMLNTADFANYANGSWWGPSRPPSFIGFSPLSAADAHDEGRALVTPAIWVDIGVIGPQW